MHRTVTAKCKCSLKLNIFVSNVFMFAKVHLFIKIIISFLALVGFDSAKMAKGTVAFYIL